MSITNSTHPRTPQPPKGADPRRFHVQRRFQGDRSAQELIRALIGAHTT